jgi:hypothetical protein
MFLQKTVGTAETMWTWMSSTRHSLRLCRYGDGAKYLYLAIRLGTLWENPSASLRATPEGHPPVVSAVEPRKRPRNHQPVLSASWRTAAAILGDPGVQRWLGRLSPEEQARFTEGLPVFVWGLDALTE